MPLRWPGASQSPPGAASAGARSMPSFSRPVGSRAPMDQTRAALSPSSSTTQPSRRRPVRASQMVVIFDALRSCRDLSGTSRLGRSILVTGTASDLQPPWSGRGDLNASRILCTTSPLNRQTSICRGQVVGRSCRWTRGDVGSRRPLCTPRAHGSSSPLDARRLKRSHPRLRFGASRLRRETAL